MTSLIVIIMLWILESKTATQFECHNRKRIPLQLQCDGFDHCGDNSDELDTCQLGKLDWPEYASSNESK